MLQMKRNLKKNGKYWPITGTKKGRSGEKVLGYIIKCKKDMMKASMIASVWEKCGLGKQPVEYTQNSNESKF